MGTRDPRVDLYIANSAEFARPVLEHLRQLVHEACPDIKETIKWRFPNFEYKGLVCNMAALSSNRVANQNFSDFAVSYRNDYVEWINAAKTAAKRRKRVETAVAWIAEGKRRNWKYERAR